MEAQHNVSKNHAIPLKVLTFKKKINIDLLRFEVCTFSVLFAGMSDFSFLFCSLLFSVGHKIWSCLHVFRGWPWWKWSVLLWSQESNWSKQLSGAHRQSQRCVLTHARSYFMPHFSKFIPQKDPPEAAIPFLLILDCSPNSTELSAWNISAAAERSSILVSPLIFWHIHMQPEDLRWLISAALSPTPTWLVHGVPSRSACLSVRDELTLKSESGVLLPLINRYVSDYFRHVKTLAWVFTCDYMTGDETCLSHPQRLWLSLSHDSWLLLYESQWVMLSALTVTEEGKVMRCCGKRLLESKQLKKCRFGNQKWKHKTWVWMAACWSTGFSSSLHCVLFLLWCLLLIFNFFLYFTTTFVEFLVVSSQTKELYDLFIGRSSESNCPGIRSGRVCRTHHSDCGHHDQVT